MSDIADFDQLLHDIETQLRREQRIAYRMLKRRYGLDDDDVEDIKADLIDAKRIAADEDGKVLVYVADPAQTRSAERRQLTVMFCDIVGSTQLSDRLDPEDFRELLRRYQQTCGRIIDEAHGHIAQYLGDGLLVYFGYPIAYEDAAERAVTCGLEIIQAMAEIKTEDGQPLQVRIGVHTGMVVIGEVGSGQTREQLALGDTPNIAARIESAASPNELIVSEATLRLLHNSFDYSSRGETALRGVEMPITLYAIERVRDLRTRYALRQAEQIPFAGRERELRRLRDGWEIAKQGIHSKYFIHAEAGIGKSRLVQEIREIARSQGGTPMTVVCTPLHSDTALYPFIELILRVLRVRPEDPATVKRERLREVLAGLRFADEYTEDVLCALLSLTKEFGSAFSELDPDQRRQKTFDTILDWMHEVTTRTPVLLVVEDLQAADPSSLELVQQGLDRFDDTPTLMILVARNEFKPPWGRRGDLIDIHLRRLDSEGIRAIISAVCGGCSLPTELVDQIEAKCDGVPLYAEEFTKMVLESDLLVRVDGKYQLGREVSNLAIPASLQDSLLARLDRLHDGKRVAQWGATIGREFSYEIIKALLPDNVADNGLKELLDLQIIYKRKRTVQTTFIFKHALIRDAAYGSLLRTERREYHARIARVLINEFQSTVVEHPEIVAQHLANAERYGEAINYWLAAGKSAGKRASNREGLGHFNKGRKLLKYLPEGRERDTLELRLQLARGPMLIPVKGNGSTVVRDCYSRALDLSNALNATEERFPILFGLRSFYLSSGNISKAHDYSLELAHIANETRDPGQRLEAHAALANTYFFRGDFVEVENQSRAALNIYDPEKFRHHVHVYGSDPGVLCLSRLSNASWQRGRPDRGRIHLTEMLVLAERLGHKFTLTSALNLAALVRVWRCEPELAFECADRSFRISEAHGYRFTYAWSRMLRGHALFDMGDIDEGMSEMEAGYEDSRDLNARLLEPWFVSILAKAKIATNQIDVADQLLDKGFAAVEGSGSEYSLPSLHCLRGELRLLSATNAGDRDSAYDSFVKAASFARVHGSRAMMVRASVGMVNSRDGAPEEAECLKVLEQSLIGFTPGDDSKDIDGALALLEQHRSAIAIKS